MTDQDRLKLYELRKELISLGSAVMQIQSILHTMHTHGSEARISAEMGELNRRIQSFLHELKSDSFND